MKIVKGVLLSLIIALIAFFIYKSFEGSDELVSPIPDSSGVKVIRVTPSQN